MSALGLVNHVIVDGSPPFSEFSLLLCKMGIMIHFSQIIVRIE